MRGILLPLEGVASLLIRVYMFAYPYTPPECQSKTSCVVVWCVRCSDLCAEKVVGNYNYVILV